MNDSMDFSVDDMETNDETSTTMILLTTLRPVTAMTAQSKLEMYLMTFANYRMSNTINTYGYISEVIVGSVTNILAISVMLGLSHLTICNYMLALALADLSVVLGPGLIRWLLTINYDPRSLSNGLCRFLNFQSYFSFSLSAWLLVAMTVDRYIAITYPLKALVWSTPKRARYVIVGIMLLMFLINMHFFFTMSVVNRANIQTNMCVVNEPYTKFMDEVWPWIDATIYSFLPFTCLLIFNYLLIRSHRRSISVYSSMGGTTKSDRSISTSKVNKKLTITLLTVTFVFLALTAPRIILTIVRTSVFNFKPTPTTINFNILASYTLTASIVNVLMIGNHCINFVLYILTGNKFRKQFVLIFKYILPRRLKQHQQVSSVKSCSSETTNQFNVSKETRDITKL